MTEGNHCCYLGSFFDPSLNQHGDMISPEQFSFFLDSGAYSAWTRGTEIDLDEYCAFIRANAEHLEVYACLDVIPGKPGRLASQAEREQAAEETWDNYLYMRREGLDPLPVYHYGEPPRFLERMLEFGCDYIGIGGLVSVSGKDRKLWLDDLFLRLTDEQGRPIVRTHGFGMTSVPLIFRYPWYSVDSTSWIQSTMNGMVMLPAVRDGAFVFDETPTNVTVSASNDKPTTLPPSMRFVLDRWLAECGKTFEEVSSHYYHRAVCNVTYFKRVSEEKALRPFQRDAKRQRGFL
jgi:hypothetical protein